MKRGHMLDRYTDTWNGLRKYPSNVMNRSTYRLIHQFVTSPWPYLRINGSMTGIWPSPTEMCIILRLGMLVWCLLLMVTQCWQDTLFLVTPTNHCSHMVQRFTPPPMRWCQCDANTASGGFKFIYEIIRRHLLYLAKWPLGFTCPEWCGILSSLYMTTQLSCWVIYISLRYSVHKLRYWLLATCIKPICTLWVYYTLLSLALGNMNLFVYNWIQPSWNINEVSPMEIVSQYELIALMMYLLHLGVGTWRSMVEGKDDVTVPYVNYQPGVKLLGFLSVWIVWYISAIPTWEKDFNNLQ
jgi:hypothetical protein